MFNKAPYCFRLLKSFVHVLHSESGDVYLLYAIIGVKFCVQMPNPVTNTFGDELDIGTIPIEDTRLSLK